jgi:hypothetical protein
MDYESSYTEDDYENPDNEDDGFEDIESSEIEEINIKDLIKGKKYKYKTPSREDDVEYSDEHSYPEGGNMYSFKGKEGSGYALGRKNVEDFLSDLDISGLYEQGGNVDDMDVDDVESAYDFVSNGPGDVYPVNELDEDDMYGYDPEKMYETMESAWADDEMEEQTDISGVQGVYGDMKRAYDFDSEGPGKAGPYQEFSYESELDEEDDFEEVDEDLKESFLTQKNKINEMFNRFKNYN